MVVVAGISFAGSAAFAVCSGSETTGESPSGTLEGRRAEAFAAIDANGDGALTVLELDQGRDRLFDLFDGDGNGSIEAGEFCDAPLGPGAHRVGVPQRMTQVRLVRFRRLDRDADGMLSPDEFAAVTMDVIMDVRDVNCDDRIVPGEILPGEPGAGR